jgi:DNA polymerase-4
VTVILHVDMDAFFAAVEVRDDPSLQGRPVVVGGAGERGVVAAASYEARAYGVRSAMPSTRARRLCPDAVFLPGRFWRYQEVSAAVFEIFRDTTPLVEGISLDEAFLDVTGATRLLGDGATIAAQIRRRVHDEQELTCSVGVAPRKLTAKLASEAAKPRASLTGAIAGRGVVEVGVDEELRFLHAHPVEALWGVGPATRARLDRLGVRTVGDLAATAEEAVVAALGRAQGQHLWALAWARDERPVVPDVKPKSIGHEETFVHDHHSLVTLDPELVRLGDAVASRLRAAGVRGRTVQVKVKFADFRLVSRSETVAVGLDQAPALLEVARRLLGSIDPTPGVRLLGISVSHLAEGTSRQLTLDEATGPGWTGATEAIDEIRSRFGDRAIIAGSLAGRGPKRRGDAQWGPDR